ncbi:MAG: tetratricopeptide repeat protein [Planctomycetes bacterium]|nr:tetratricopeptide repeat protein [Planctomycetota bacterium]
MSVRIGVHQMRLAAAIAGIGLALLLPACRTNPHAVDKKQAEKRWNEVRGRVKYQLADQQFSRGLFEDAAANAAEALSLDPTRPESFAMLAKCHLEMNKPASAQQAIDLARQLGLKSAELDYMQGVLFEQRDRSDEAIQEYAKAQSLDPTKLDYLIALVENLVVQGHIEKARSIIEKEAAQVDDDGSIAVLSAYIALLTDQVEEAAAHLRSAMAHGTKSDLVQLELGRILVRMHRYGEALPLLQPLLERFDETELDGVLRRAAATCYMNQDEPGEAKHVLLDYARRHPNDATAQLLLAKAAIAGGDTMTALAAVTRAEKKAGHHPEVRFVRAVLHWKRGESDAAATLLYAIIDESPNDVDAHCLLAEVRLLQDLPESARAQFERALQIDPTCAWAEAALRTIG